MSMVMNCPFAQEQVILLQVASLRKGGGEHLLLDKTISKKEFIDFYTYTNFKACRYCDVLNEKERTLPAIQIKEAREK